MAIDNRRVVTGLDADGRSCVLFDGPVDAGERSALVWSSATIPASNVGTADAGGGGFSFDSLRGGGSHFMLVEFQPGVEGRVHVTDTLDYAVLLRGRLMLTLEAGAVELNPGDIVVDRGVVHSWHAIGSESALLAAIMVPAEPVGRDATK